MAILLFLFIILISIVVIRVGAVALELTGLPQEQARFQALSAFSTSGFTTKEAERITSHYARRRIVSALMVLGNAGLITLVGAFVGSVIEGGSGDELTNFVILLVGVLILAWVSSFEIVKKSIKKWARSWLESHYDLSPTLPEELLRFDQGYGLRRVTIKEDSPVVGRTLGTLRLKKNMVQVLAIERGEDFLAVPAGDAELLGGDIAVVYGSGDKIDNVFADCDCEELLIVQQEEQEVVVEEGSTPEAPQSATQH